MPGPILVPDRFSMNHNGFLPLVAKVDGTSKIFIVNTDTARGSMDFQTLQLNQHQMGRPLRIQGG